MTGYKVGDEHPSIKEKNMQEENQVKCGCGRSPTGFCIGWHDLTEDQYQATLDLYCRELLDESED